MQKDRYDHLKKSNSDINLRKDLIDSDSQLFNVTGLESSEDEVKEYEDNEGELARKDEISSSLKKKGRKKLRRKTRKKQAQDDGRASIYKEDTKIH